MHTIFIGLAILLGVSSVAMAILYLLYKVDKQERYPVADITYDHIEEDIVKLAQRKKRKAANAKRKPVKKTKND